MQKVIIILVIRLAWQQLEALEGKKKTTCVWVNSIANSIPLNHNDKPKSVNKKLKMTWITKQTGMAAVPRRMFSSAPQSGAYSTQYTSNYV